MALRTRREAPRTRRLSPPLQRVDQVIVCLQFRARCESRLLQALGVYEIDSFAGMSHLRLNEEG